MATTKTKKYIVKDITKNTILGVLCRLIGDQRKLYQVKESENYYFRELEDEISFQIDPQKECISEETVYIVNKSEKRPAQKKFLGVIPDDTPLFFSKTAPKLWSVLYLDIKNLLNFIISGDVCNQSGSSHPTDLLVRIRELTDNAKNQGAPLITIERKFEILKEQCEKIKNRFQRREEKYISLGNPTKPQISSFQTAKTKYIEDLSDLQTKIDELKNDLDQSEFDERLMQAIGFLNRAYPDESYLENGRCFRISLYSAALYLQAERLILSGLSLEYCTNKQGKIFIQGFSKRGFNGIRDFLNRLAGNKKKTIGTPYPLTKSSGFLDIRIDVDKDKAIEIESLIRNAGVSSFYLGKKGIAYVSDIRI